MGGDADVFELLVQERGERFSCDRAILQRQDFVVQIFVVKRAAQLLKAPSHILIARIKLRCFRAQCDSGAVVVPMAERRSGDAKELFIFPLAQVRRHGLTRGGELEPVIRVA